MNISYRWLKDLIDTDLSADELGKKLTSVGLAVEGIHPHGDDLVLDIDLTSNRPDCLSHLGVAREIGVIEKIPLRVNQKGHNATAPSGDPFVFIDRPELCHRFTGRIIRNVKIGPSPQWLVDRLEAIGERSINNVADITNYVMHELGQPMHSFDLDKISGDRLIVRTAKHGETITTLDEVSRTLDESMLVICDIEKPVAVAGIMGGLDSSITGNTVNVLLEVALFRRDNIRATSRRLNLATEASYRFERGVDIESVLAASSRAAKLICELAGGVDGEFVDIYPTRTPLNSVSSKNISQSVKRLTGLDVEISECTRILTALGLAFSSDGSTGGEFVSPSWRHDISIEEDLVEEIARHTGYQNIASVLPPAYGAGEYQPMESREKLLRQTLVNIGFNEALSYSFIDTKFDTVFETIPGLVDDEVSEKYVTLRDSVIDGAVRMRPSVISGLLDAVRLNLNHQRRDLRLFELGKVFAAAPIADGLPNEQKSLGIVVTGQEVHEDRAMPTRPLDFYDAKGAVEAALESAGVTNLAFANAEVKHLRKGQAATIFVGDILIGYLGLINDEIAASYKFRQPVYVAELNLSLVAEARSIPVVYQPLNKYPAVVRDVSFIVDRQTAFGDIRKTVFQQKHELCKNVVFVDLYEGKGLDDNDLSITIRLEYRSDDRTLIEDEVESLHQEIVARTAEGLGIRSRF